eukprot:6469232-Amphidinium_carterae.1
MAADINPASQCMYFQGFSGGGHLSKDTHPGDQINQRLDDATSADIIPYLPESYDDTCERMPSIFAERSVPAARADGYPWTLRTGSITCPSEGSEIGVCPSDCDMIPGDAEPCDSMLSYEASCDDTYAKKQ